MEETLERGLEEEEENEAVQSLRSAVAIAIFSPISPTLLSSGFQFVKKVLGDLGLVSVGCRPILNFYIPFLCVNL